MTFAPDINLSRWGCVSAFAVNGDDFQQAICAAAAGWAAYDILYDPDSPGDGRDPEHKIFAVSASQPTQDPALRRFRIPKSERGQSVRPTPVERAETQTRRGSATGGDYRNLSRAVQPRGGYRDNS